MCTLFSFIRAKLCWWDACKHKELLYWCRLLKHPVIIRRVQLRLTSNRLVCLLLLHVGAQYSASANTGARAEVWNVDGLAPPSCTRRFMDKCTVCHDLISSTYKMMSVGECPGLERLIQRESRYLGFIQLQHQAPLYMPLKSVVCRSSQELRALYTAMEFHSHRKILKNEYPLLLK